VRKSEAFKIKFDLVHDNNKLSLQVFNLICSFSAQKLEF